MLFRLLEILVAVATLCFAYGVFIERKSYRLARRARLPILPAGGPESLTLLHLSDLHFVRNDTRKARFLANLPEADIAVVTGDFLAEPEAVDAAVAGVRPARGQLASYFVLGSNDLYRPQPFNPVHYFSWRLRLRRRKRIATRNLRGPVDELVSGLEADGWIHLPNERREDMLGGLPLEVVGLNDPHAHFSDLRVAPRRAPERLGVALVHSPDPAPELVALGYDLVLAGHTHGGQVRTPWGALVNNSSLPLHMTDGLFRFGSSYLHVSRGIGTSKYAPFRFLCRPEAHLLELEPKPG